MSGGARASPRPSSVVVTHDDTAAAVGEVVRRAQTVEGDDGVPRGAQLGGDAWVLCRRGRRGGGAPVVVLGCEGVKKRDCVCEPVWRLGFANRTQLFF